MAVVRFPDEGRAVTDEAAVRETLARGVPVRLAAYSPSSLSRLDLPAPIVCSEPAAARLLGAS